MTTNATSGQESDASNPDREPITDAREDGETVHSAGDWELSVLPTGSVEATQSPAGAGINHWATRGQWSAPNGGDFSYDLSIEQLLARYAHETRFERDSQTENGAALRDGIIRALQRQCDSRATCGKAGCEARATHVVHTNAPTGPTTALVCDDHASEGTYATLYALENVHEQESEGGDDR